MWGWGGVLTVAQPRSWPLPRRTLPDTDLASGWKRALAAWGLRWKEGTWQLLRNPCLRPRSHWGLVLASSRALSGDTRGHRGSGRSNCSTGGHSKCGDGWSQLVGSLGSRAWREASLYQSPLQAWGKGARPCQGWWGSGLRSACAGWGGRAVSSRTPATGCPTRADAAPWRPGASSQPEVGHVAQEACRARSSGKQDRCEPLRWLPKPCSHSGPCATSSPP